MFAAFKRLRVGSSAVTREDFLQSLPSGRLLEIGPGPSPICGGANTDYFDIASSADLRARLTIDGVSTANIPEVIHYVSPEADLSICPTDYSGVISSHNVEHQPDLVWHLKQAFDRLRPGGEFILIIPDKRYCFDHYLPESTLADVLEAHMERRKVHAPRAVIAHRALTTHNDAARHWAGDHGEPRKGLEWATYAMDEIKAANGGYIDVHAWQFTPSSFRTILADLSALGLNPFLVDFVGETPFGRFEFCARLRKAAQS